MQKCREVGRLTTKRPHNVCTHLMGTPLNTHATSAYNEHLTNRVSNLLEGLKMTIELLQNSEYKKLRRRYTSLEIYFRPFR